jgi:hypothetical protein
MARVCPSYCVSPLTCLPLLMGALSQVFGRVASGRGSGTIGRLTHGVLTREEYYEQAVVGVTFVRDRFDIHCQLNCQAQHSKPHQLDSAGRAFIHHVTYTATAATQLRCRLQLSICITWGSITSDWLP